MTIPQMVPGIHISARHRIANLCRFAHRYSYQAMDNMAGIICVAKERMSYMVVWFVPDDTDGNYA